MSSFKVASCNILADSYVRPEWFAHIDPEILKWEKRSVALLRKIAGFDADVICLQEVTKDAYVFFDAHLSKSGYQGCFAKKEQKKPDGCATFFRQRSLQYKDSRTIYYSDGEGEANTGHLALISSFVSEAGVISIANTHVKWDVAGKPEADHLGYRQIRELIHRHIKADQTTDAWIICGDFNAPPDSPLITELLNNGFVDAYQGAAQNTCNSNRAAKRIDFLFHTSNLKAKPTKIKDIDGLTPLPSEDEPSDHLAVSAVFE
jgi:mRNA deadenylase 3'-5' endonuclease subunit Ccr4